MDDPVTSGKNTALLDVYYISCQGWMDPNRHNIIKYVFKGKIIKYDLLKIIRIQKLIFVDILIHCFGF